MFFAFGLSAYPGTSRHSGVLGGEEFWEKEQTMEPYKNLSGTSGVAAYAIGEGSITVEFKKGSVYLYNNQSAGADNISIMQRLAIAGKGLSMFISQVVRKDYAKKLR
jgi:hypothetical protein